METYNYENLKDRIFTDEGQREFLKVRDHVGKLLARAGAFMMVMAFEPISGDTWLMMAYVDRMVELGEIVEITKDDVPGQCRVFVRG